MLNCWCITWPVGFNRLKGVYGRAMVICSQRWSKIFVATNWSVIARWWVLWVTWSLLTQQGDWYRQGMYKLVQRYDKHLKVWGSLWKCGDHSSTVVKVLCYKSEGRWLDCRWYHWNFSLTWSFRSHYGPGIDSASNRNEYQEYFLGVKAAGA